MILTFSSSDTVYKIFKTLKKVPSYKKVTISIASDHELFNHDWRGTQLHELVEHNHLHATFLATTTSESSYFTRAGLTTIRTQDQGVLGAVRRLWNSMRGGSTTQSTLLKRSNAPGYLIVVAEIAVLVLVGVFFWGVISPKAIIEVQPSVSQKSIVYQYFFYPATQTLEELPTDIRLRNTLSIPYYIGELDYTYEITSDIERIVYTYTPGTGTAELRNSGVESISLRSGTRLQGNNIIYTTNEPVTVPAGSEEQPGTVQVAVTASEDLLNPQGVGKRSNASAGTPLSIVSGSEQDLFELTAVLSDSVTGGLTTSTGTVQESDVSLIEEKIRTRMEESVREELRNADLPDEQIIVMHPDMIGFRFTQFISSASPGDEITFVDGKGVGTIRYRYYRREDLYTAIRSYISQRPSLEERLLEINDASLTAYDPVIYTLEQDEGSLDYFQIPVRVDTIRTYDLEEDIKRITQEMRETVAGRTKEEARKILIDYPQVRDVNIRINPGRYTTLPNEYQRIQIEG